MRPASRYIDLSAARIRLEGAAAKISRTGYAVGALGVIATALLMARDAEAWQRGLLSWLVNWSFFLSLALGSLFFVMLQHATKAGWSVVVRRLAEGFASSFVVLALLSVPILLGLDSLFEWARPEAVAADPLLAMKAPYLNRPFFFIRMAVYFAAWIGLARWFFARSTEQDATGDPALTTRMMKVSGPAIMVFAVTMSFAGFDLLMSLEPDWFSTMFGVYFFAGGVLGAFSLLPLTTYLLQRSGRLAGLVSLEHYHDMGKLMFAFVVFWSYIAFSQYMLIWYANIPEESVWYLERQTGQWTAFSWFLLVGHFLVPFLALISRIPKRRPGLLVAAALWLLLVHWCDLYWVAMPHASPGRVSLDPVDLTAFLAIGGLWVGGFGMRMRNRPLVPERDPRLGESLAFENF